MKQYYFLLLLSTFYINAQDVVKTYEPVTIIKQRVIELNGGTRAVLSGGKSRVSIKIDLPVNTVGWYYSFSTSNGTSGTQNLNLATQIAAALLSKSNMVGALVSSTGITKAVVSKFEVPEGTSSIDVYLCDKINIDKFERKIDNLGGTYSYYREGTVENTRNGIIQIDDYTNGTWYLGIKNPSSLDAANVTIEVVALVEKTTIIEKSENQTKAELYGNLGWTQFENGNHKKCIEYSNKANEYFELGWVYANIGLAQLVLGKESDAMEAYVNAITLIKKQNNSEYIFSEIIKDLQKEMFKNPSLSGASDICKLILLSK